MIICVRRPNTWSQFCILRVQKPLTLRGLTLMLHSDEIRSLKNEVDIYAGLESFQDGSHFSASPVPHLRHLRHLLIMCLILRHLFQSTNENAVLQNYFIILLMHLLHIFLCSIQQVFISYLKYLPSILSLERPVFWSLAPNLGAPLKAT